MVNHLLSPSRPLRYLRLFFLLCSLSGLSACAAANPVDNASKSEDIEKFIQEMVKKHQFQEKDLRRWMADAVYQQGVIDAISRPAEKVKPWKDYRAIFMTEDRILKGVQFWKDHESLLKEVEQRYKVNAEIIVAVLGVETRYGRTQGNYRVVDSLSTLAFGYPPRAKFFRQQLEEFFLLAREQNHDPLDLKGSYAGAMGYGQFIPSSYRHFAVDYDGDGFADIWNNPADAIASIANYFKEHRWEMGRMVATRCHIKPDYDASLFSNSLKPAYGYEELQKRGVEPLERGLPNEIFSVYKLEGELGAEFWAGAHNFYVITRYNHSHMYALATYQLSQAIKEKYLRPSTPPTAGQ
jgi:membrane-bound lytic murein transglycosylase B